MNKHGEQAQEFLWKLLEDIATGKRTVVAIRHDVEVIPGGYTWTGEKLPHVAERSSFTIEMAGVAVR